ncbi:uncharacterized protein LOC108029583 [Drosophila biarmipes]|uniref:uncharacterized protein LOC108029583 n=1 Tax=Drosophila biarmipes TaxID=125945 RepID=UPI0007E78C60|nr:uncharacterized protein LOC108029583 [Drosophila biarmipes]
MRSALRIIRRPGFRSFACKAPKFPDPSCLPVDPRCHHVPGDRCIGAKEVLARELPREKYLDQYEGTEGRCCVLRSADKDPCAVMKRPKVPKAVKEPFRSMWEPPCLADEQPFCKDKLPRFDAIHYHPSKKCRCYQRTWVECPPVKQRLKKVCCLDGIHPPEVLYRVKDPCPNVCGMPYRSLRRLCEVGDLERDPESKCSKLFWPCCKPARCDPRCRKPNTFSICTKLRAPYPSFSEMRGWTRPRRKIECQCLNPVPQCIAVREKMRMDRFNLKPSCYRPSTSQTFEELI